jgi:hypothetical protein
MPSFSAIATMTPPKVPGSEGGMEAIPRVEIAFVLRIMCDKYGGVKNELPLVTNDLLMTEFGKLKETPVKSAA